MGPRLAILALAIGLAGVLALPGTAEAVPVAAVSQSATQIVKPGGTASITITVANHGSETIPAEGIGMFPTRVRNDGAVDDPYQSVTPSQGTCTSDDTGAYRHQSCALGALPPGASVQIVAVLRMNVAMDHRVYIDNGEPSTIVVALDLPTVVSGSSKIKLTGLPTGCGRGDFTLGIKAKGARRITVFGNFGFDSEGEGVIVQQAKKASKLNVKVPIASVEDPDPMKYATLRITARTKRAKLKKTVQVANCTRLRNQSGLL